MAPHFNQYYPLIVAVQNNPKRHPALLLLSIVLGLSAGAIGYLSEILVKAAG
jgi:hypothetical protein